VRVDRNLNTATVLFPTTQVTVPLVEVSKPEPGPGLRFDPRWVVAQVSNGAAGQQTRHSGRIDNLKPGTLYHYIITVADAAGKPVKEVGKFATSIRFD
jgi:hypothetical protein